MAGKSNTEHTWSGYTGQRVISLIDDCRERIRNDSNAPKTLSDILEAIRHSLPKAVSDLDYEIFKVGFYRAQKLRPSDYDRWISLARQWAGRQWDGKPEAAREFLDEWIFLIAGESRAAVIGQLFDRVERQYGDRGKKFRQLLRYRNEMKANPVYWPRPPRPAVHSDANAEAVKALMRADPSRAWTVSQLARKRRTTVKAMIHLTGAMRDRGDLMFEDVGRGLLVLRTPKVEVRQSHAQLTIGKLIEAPNGIELYALKNAIGMASDQPVRTLLGIGVVEAFELRERNGPVRDSRGRTVRRGALVKLTPDALTKIKQSQPIYDRRGAIIWPPLTAK
jgi:hypothetical protein